MGNLILYVGNVILTKTHLIVCDVVFDIVLILCVMLWVVVKIVVMFDFVLFGGFG